MLAYMLWSAEVISGSMKAWDHHFAPIATWRIFISTLMAMSEIARMMLVLLFVILD